MYNGKNWPNILSKSDGVRTARLFCHLHEGLIIQNTKEYSIQKIRAFLFLMRIFTFTTPRTVLINLF